MKKKIISSILAALFCACTTQHVELTGEVQEGYEIVINYDNIQVIDFNE